ncbi:hypothetical protein ACX3O0_14510 [Homoserinimonas sp. A447]
MPIEKLSLYTVTPVWVLLALAAGFILLFAHADAHLLWFSVSLATGIILTFCIQLGLDRKEGLVNRVMASLGGSIVVLAIATGVSALLG